MHCQLGRDGTVHSNLSSPVATGSRADPRIPMVKPPRRRRGGVPQAHEPNPDEPKHLSDFRFFAVVKTWMDEDIIEATVRNALVHGVETVYVVDNDSTDATVQNAEAAGAVIGEIYHSELFDEEVTQMLVNALVVRESLRCGAEHIWWLYLDSDEFPEGPDGISLRDYLSLLDERFRIVGAKCINHLPTAKPEYLSGFHPIDFQPLCYEYPPLWITPCGQEHWKHPLQRFDQRANFLRCASGSHVARCVVPVTEPTGGIVIHHFQYRERGIDKGEVERPVWAGLGRATPAQLSSVQALRHSGQVTRCRLLPQVGGDEDQPR